jgi:hypothetical protein
MLDWMVPRVLLVLGAGFLVANFWLLIQLLRFLRLRSAARLTWSGPKHPSTSLFLVLGIVLGAVLLIEIALPRTRSGPQSVPSRIFGEAMMFTYYALLLPLTSRIARGFYEDGIWVENGYMPYAKIGGLTWREDAEITLVLIPRMKRLARRLVVPRQYYAEARKLLREKIAGHDIHFTGKPLDLGAHDERDDV